jgi:hypothetical protein
MDIITICVGMGIRGPIAEGDYNVGDAKISISYPQQIKFGLPGPIDLPKSLSTVFTVSWQDKNGRTAARLRSKSFEKFMPIYDAIDKINEILLAFKLVRIGHADGMGLRTVGLGDTLFYFSCINDQPTGNLNMGIKTYRRYYNWAYPKGSDPDDPHGTTQLARPHIASDTYKVARRYVRCYELLEHGFYTEAFIVAFSVLDDLVQQMLNRLLEDKGIVSNRERKDFLRGIKEQRLRTFLGPLLKVITGKDIFTMWPGSEKALEWLNGTRNRLAHRGEKADYATAALGIFACVKTLTVLSQNQLAEADFTVEFFRHSKITAAWTENAPDWVPSGSLAESMDFNS